MIILFLTVTAGFSCWSGGFRIGFLLTPLLPLLCGVMVAIFALIPDSAFAAESAPAALPASRDAARLKARLEVEFVPDALRRAAKDLAETYPGRCKQPAQFEEK